MTRRIVTDELLTGIWYASRDWTCFSSVSLRPCRYDVIYRRRRLVRFALVFLLFTVG